MDPDYRRWGRKYPRFPGVVEYIRLLQTGNARGAWLDIIIDDLALHAGETLPELVDAFRSVPDERTRLLILMAIVEARLPSAIPFLAAVSRERHPRFAPYAERGLSQIGTREARGALWEARNA
jgi:hypothetical protein